MTNSTNFLPSLTRTECSAMRGLAILGIMLHNYCHWLKIAVKENEYTFSQANADGLMGALQAPSINLPVHLLSFFGHYGVPVFLFLSAYGLTMKYERGGAEDRIWPFIKKHVVKLWTMMIVGFALFLCVDRMIDAPHHYRLFDVVSMIGMFGNITTDPDHIIWPGPYWFFGLMMQLYIIYRLVLYKRHWGVTVGLMAVCMAVQMLMPTQEALNIVRYNFVGSMLPFGMGLLYGRCVDNIRTETTIQPQGKAYVLGSKKLCAILAISMLLVIVGWSLDAELWFFVPAAVCFFAVALVKVTPEKVNVWLAWTGGISSAMFVCHAATRKLFIGISRQGDVYTGLLIYIVVTFVLSYYLQKVFAKRG